MIKPFNIFNIFLSFLTILLLPLAAFSIILDKFRHKRMSNSDEIAKIGYYIGFFDPVNENDEAIINYLINNKICDCVFIYAACDSDSYKGIVDIKIRLEMLSAAFQNNPKVMVTNYNLKQIQEFFIQITNKSSKFSTAKKSFAKSVAIIDPALALNLKSEEEVINLFMNTEKNKKENESLSDATPMSFDSFMVFLRDQDDGSKLKEKIGDKPLIQVQIENKNISSTQIREMVKFGEPITDLVDSKITEIISKYSLYKN